MNNDHLLKPEGNTDLQQFNPQAYNALINYVDQRIEEISTKRMLLQESEKKEYELPSKEFLNLITYVEYLATYRHEFFSWDTELRFKDGKTDQNEFDTDLAKLKDTLSNVDSFLANINDSDFLLNVQYLFRLELSSLREYLNKVDYWGDNETHNGQRVVYRRLYNILQGNGTRISDLIQSNGFTVAITPYHDNLDLACSNISAALKQIEPELNRKGIIVDERVYYILEKGPAHEKAHHEAYINYRPDQAEGRRQLLTEGRSRLSEWVYYSVELQIRRQGNKIVAGMTAGIPTMSSLDEIIHVYLAPEEPSLGDVLLTAAEIFRSLDPSSALYQEILKALLEVCEELNLFSHIEDLPNFLIGNMTNFYDGDYFIKNQLDRNMRGLRDSLPGHLVRLIKSYKEK